MNFIKYNVSKWGTSADQNILYLTGLPGSGKTTISELISSDIIIHLDDYLYFDSEKNGEDEFTVFLNIYEPNWIRLIELYKNNAKWFLDILLLYANKKYYEGKKIIVEGFQIFSGWLCTYNFFIGKPIIIIKEKLLICMLRIYKRDNIRSNLASFISTLCWFIKFNIQIKKLCNIVREEWPNDQNKLETYR